MATALSVLPRVSLGGCWRSDELPAVAASVFAYVALRRFDFLGFRLVRRSS